MTNLIVLPTCLFHENYSKYENIYIVEDPYYFTKFKYHKMKLIYHRATMKTFNNLLISKKTKTKYINYKDANAFYRNISKSSSEFHMYDPIDKEPKEKIIKTIKNIKILQTKNFLINQNDINEFVKNHAKSGKFLHHTFYKWQRRRLDILMDPNRKDPLNIDNETDAKWSYDTENRQRFPKDTNEPFKISKLAQSPIIREAQQYINTNFPNNYGETDIYYPISRNAALVSIRNFFKNKIENFGPYQDASQKDIVFGYHSILSPMLNIGIITDTDVVNYFKKYVNSLDKKDLKKQISSLEGFIRQLIGWRNYMYMVYTQIGDNLRKSNYMNHNNKIPYKQFWEGTTGIDPVDDIIKRIQKYAYAHHIERLMFLGNYMFISKYHPNDVYKMFMEWTIDAYDWVMVPNVYGMSQFSGGRIITTRPYYSSSNYIVKMSRSYSRKESWAKKWDNLYANINYQVKY